MGLLLTQVTSISDFLGLVVLFGLAEFFLLKFYWHLKRKWVYWRERRRGNASDRESRREREV